MTVNEALTRAAESIGDSVPREKLLIWLSEIEDTVDREIAATHTCCRRGTDVRSDGEAVLLVPDPQSEVYILYMQMKYDLMMHDNEQYNNSAPAFAAAYSTYADSVNRECMPISAARVTL